MAWRKFSLEASSKALLFYSESAEGSFDLCKLTEVFSYGAPKNWHLVELAKFQTADNTSFSRFDQLLRATREGNFDRVAPPFVIQRGNRTLAGPEIPLSPAWRDARPSVYLNHNAKPRRWVELEVLPFFPQLSFVPNRTAPQLRGLDLVAPTNAES